MKGIIDYTVKYGQKSLEELPFNEVDSLVLSQLSYLKFNHVIPYDTDVILSKIQQSKYVEEIFSDKRYEKPNRELFSSLINSIRYKNVLIRDFFDISDPVTNLQFSAMSFVFHDDLAYIAFRGTDDTITGWHEDFNMIYNSPVPSQIHAVSYLNNFASKYEGKMIVGGHSKGGNLAVYAFAKCDDSYKDRIKRIYSHDGPGFIEGVLTDAEKAAVDKKLRKTVPKASIVGMLMQTEPGYEVVDCKSYGLKQHDPFNWRVNGSRFKRYHDLHKHSTLQSESINEWVRQMSLSDRRDFVEAVFEAFDRAGITNLNEINSEPSRCLQRLSSAVDDMSTEKRDMVYTFMRQLFKMRFDKSIDNVKSSLEHFR
ncbi:MAG: DUF2974 domain-containing protein [Lachnospiraceae bacterium]|nr:DUF2974 domain-containing protein [Lachnospiraceae bacterium]